MDSKVQLLKNTRKFVRKMVTEVFNKRVGFVSLSEQSKGKLRLNLNDWLSQLENLDSDILQHLSDACSETEAETILSDELRSCQDYKDKIFECQSALSQSESINNVNTVNTSNSVQRMLKCPEAPLPVFNSDENEDLDKFFREFDETTDRYSYSDYDKLLLMKKQLKGRALLLVNSLESDNQSYSKAKQLLKDALASPDQQKFSIIKQLKNLQMSDISDPFEYVSKMRSLSESVSKLKIDSDIFLQYFFLDGMTDLFKSQLIQITNKTRPSLKEINDNLFSACERYLSVKNQKSNIDKSNFKSTLAMAVKVENKSFVSCVLCSDKDKSADHRIYACRKFSTGIAKINKLTELKGCTKCASVSHETNKCKFRLKRPCKFCSNWHFDFLCTKNNEKTTKKCSDSNVKIDKAEVQKNVNCKVVYYNEVLKCETDSDSILPTFSIGIGNTFIRALKDSGCVSNLISADIAEKLKLNIIEKDITLNICGINGSRKYITNKVQFEAKFNDKVNILTAICIPKINVSLRVPELDRIIHEFEQRNYILADKDFKDCRNVISNVNFILGTKSTFCIYTQLSN